jgi:hypothetical protein
MVKLANLIRENGEQIAWLEASLVGKESMIGKFDIHEAAELFICRSSPKTNTNR